MNVGKAKNHAHEAIFIFSSSLALVCCATLSGGGTMMEEQITGDVAVAKSQSKCSTNPGADQ